MIEAEGFTTSDLTSIFVDQDTYVRHVHRYRFTLAHEVGHILLHSEIFARGVWSSVEEWKAFINSIPDREHGWLEYQAYSFGGLVLVPSVELRGLASEAVARVRDEGIRLRENWDFAWTTIAAHLAKQFEVSTQVIEKRLQRDEICEEFQA